MKKFTKSALATAVIMGAGASFVHAGTEACFEVYRVTTDAVDGVNDESGAVAAHDTKYTPASCDTTRTAAAATELQAIDTPKIAWELTGNVSPDLETIGDQRTQIVYIPTTDVPPASRITMRLNGANFGTGNANQMYLVSQDSGGGNYQTVASSDAAFDETSEVEFLTKAGVTIGAGTRLLLSALNPDDVAATDDLIQGISINIQNTETCTPTPEVTIEALTAYTDGGSTITGAQSNGLTTALVDISEQFELVAGANDTTEVDVDAEDPSFRQQFVNNGQSGGAWDNQTIATAGATDTSSFWEARFIDSYDDFDLAVDLAADDEVTVSVKTDSATGDGVTLSFLANIGAGASDEVGDGSALDATQADHISVGATDDVILLDIEEEADDLIELTETATTYTIDANDIWQAHAGVGAASADIYVAARLMNSDDEIMEFNYDVDTTWSLDFDDNNLLDKTGCETPTPFEVGVNGAVLKAPYVYTVDGGGFVRITSEHTSEATIFMDIFGEDTATDPTGKETKNVNVGTVAPKSSVVLTTPALLAAAEAAGFTPTANGRHSMTFTVTAPKNKIHGAAVQKKAGDGDRVMAVLDQNDWSE